ncbi:MAG: DegT/DnrJ/EryC1/StrS family aminotransferase [Bacteroidales bacterium]|jgi:dTDP-4-amino-4,6-dideoxygalactose transaminase|nr:DegT/DnrJ/EryC1/StrS family aminotransferase [Bacteroidales bacterium]
MENRKLSRRHFIGSVSAVSAGIATSGLAPAMGGVMTTDDKLAILGGNPVHTGSWPKWPRWIPETDEPQLLKVMRSGVWSRAGLADEFERQWAKQIGAKRCLAVVNGTGALHIALAQLGLGGGDEVIVTPYTFIASVSTILMTGAMPVFADIDPETFQISPEQIEKKITPRTRAILPVHILGLPADMPRIMAIAKKHNLVVVEDACQAWLAEINHQKVGTFGNAGCFSFQNSKNIAIGEGGAIVSNDDELMDRCYSFHNFGNPYGSAVGSVGVGTIMAGTKLRMAEYQAAIGLAQLPRLDAETTLRNENAAYLRSKLVDIPGILPYKLYEGVTRAAYHLFPFRYKKEHFKGLSRRTFLRALQAEGVPCSVGYTVPLNRMAYLEHTFNSKNYRKMYPAELLDIRAYNEQNVCPEADRICTEEAVWFTQNMLLGSRKDMDDIASAIDRIRKNADKILNK